MIYIYKLTYDYNLICETAPVIQNNEDNMLVFEKEYAKNIVCKNDLNKIRYDYTYYSISPLLVEEENELYKDLLKMKLVAIQFILDDIKYEYKQRIKTIQDRKKIVISKLTKL